MEDANMTESEEMYLVMIASEKEINGAAPVSIPRLAEMLNLQPASVNQMIRKLEESAVVTYLPYKGVDLTSTGSVMANRILRHRRLWEVFLVDELHFVMETAEPLACKMEHIFPEEAIERLAKYLNYPNVAPDGKRIPTPAEHQPMRGISLTSMAVGQQGRLVDIHSDPAARSFLSQKGVQIGSWVRLIALSDDKDVLVELEDGHHLQLAESIARDMELDLDSVFSKEGPQ
jgi:DtxR family Mn-dependent transcriptional regulator